MVVAEYIVSSLVNLGVTDVFGLPGGVVLDFLYAADANPNIEVHLSNHEQAAGYAAIGYAQSSKRLGVAYATRGPGFTNLITPIADAYFDSIPVFFITGHTKNRNSSKVRFIEEQEFDTISVVDNITKYSCWIDSVSQVKEELIKLFRAALTGRCGSVFLDISVSTLRAEINEDLIDSSIFVDNITENLDKDCSLIIEELRKAQCPVILIGNGVRQSSSEKKLIEFAEKLQIPVLSSSISVDVVNSFDFYFGYIGSHGSRLANLILMNTDFILSLGNRMAYNRNSDTFGCVSHKKVMRIEVDSAEIDYEQKNTVFITVELRKILTKLVLLDYANIDYSEWMAKCREVRAYLDDYDFQNVHSRIGRLLKMASEKTIFVSDVGNNEFFLLQSYRYSKLRNRLLMSKSFSALGSSLPKAIGTYYSSREIVVAFMGDQGALFNVQELLYISKHHLPIKIIILNNKSSGMIKSRELIQKRNKLLHTTSHDGYYSADFRKIAKAFDIDYYIFDTLDDETLKKNLYSESPCLIEVDIDEDLELPQLPKGNKMYDFEPNIDSKLISKIRNIMEC